MGILKTINQGLKSINKVLDSAGKAAESLSIKATHMKDEVAINASKDTLKLVRKTKEKFSDDPEGFKQFLKMAEAYGMHKDVLKLLKESVPETA